MDWKGNKLCYRYSSRREEFGWNPFSLATTAKKKLVRILGTCFDCDDCGGVIIHTILTVPSQELDANVSLVTGLHATEKASRLCS